VQHPCDGGALGLRLGDGGHGSLDPGRGDALRLALGAVRDHGHGDAIGTVRVPVERPTENGPY
jgi:hypothetical protein